MKAQIHLLKLGKLKFIRCLEQLLHFRTLVIFWSYQDRGSFTFLLSIAAFFTCRKTLLVLIWTDLIVSFASLVSEARSRNARCGFARSARVRPIISLTISLNSRIPEIESGNMGAITEMGGNVSFRIAIPAWT